MRAEEVPLFPEAEDRRRRPLAEILRPTTWEQFAGFEDLDPGLQRRLSAGGGAPPSLILWGPPGVGKTTFARIVGRSFDCEFVQFSAVLQGVKDVRELVTEARRRRSATLLFVDEIHRFTRAQQDALLPHIEDGTIAFIGATTENPSFYLTSALLSRARLVTLRPLSMDRLRSLILRAATALGVRVDERSSELIANAAAGDGRRAVSMVDELRSQLYARDALEITPEDVERYLAEGSTPRYDRSGEEHYNMVSAFIKSLRGSDPDAALFWAFRMLAGGEDPLFLLRRLIIFASEDIGNADPRALPLAVAAYDAFERVGMPEGEIPLAQAITFLASAPKSNRSYVARNEVKDLVKRHPVVTVPLHIRNAPTSMMEREGYGKGYQYPHDTEAGFVPGIQYLPSEVGAVAMYRPKESGFEKTIRELRRLRGQT